MTGMKVGIRCLLAVLAIVAPAQAGVITYSFDGFDTSSSNAVTEVFELTLANFVSPTPNGTGVTFACGELDNSTNCSDSGIIFSEQSNIVDFSAQLQFDTPTVGSIFFSRRMRLQHLAPTIQKPVPVSTRVY